jgi:hypothetical protein
MPITAASCNATTPVWSFVPHLYGIRKLTFRTIESDFSVLLYRPTDLIFLWGCGCEAETKPHTGRLLLLQLQLHMYCSYYLLHTHPVLESFVQGQKLSVRLGGRTDDAYLVYICTPRGPPFFFCLVRRAAWGWGPNWGIVERISRTPNKNWLSHFPTIATDRQPAHLTDHGPRIDDKTASRRRRRSSKQQ